MALPLPGQPGGPPQLIPYLYYLYYLYNEDAGPAIEFMAKAFGFDVEFVFRSPSDDRVLTATVRTGSGKRQAGSCAQSLTSTSVAIASTR